MKGAGPHQRPSLLDRLCGAPPRQSLEELKEAVARDLEALLNTRCCIGPEPDGFPECARSLLTYGLADFAGRSLGSASDRDWICACLKAAIERHEPRLKNVVAQLEADAGSINRIRFSIRATLVARSGETVSFDADLQPSSLHYTIQRGA